MNRAPGPGRGEQGFALVITLIVTALLVALAAEFVDEVFVETTLSHNFVAEQQASVLAASGVDGAVALLKFTRDKQGYTTLSDPWAKPIQVPDEAGTLTVTVEEESAKLNLNNIAGDNGTFLPPHSDTFLRLLKNRGISTDVADALADWFDRNEEPHPGGAESSYYSALKPPYKSKNGFLETVEELRLVKGVDQASLEKLRSFITVYSNGLKPSDATPININTAPKEVLAALQYGSSTMTDALADAVIDYRKTTPIKSIADFGNVPGIGNSMATGFAGFVTFQGSVFRIRSEARVKETRRTVETVVRIANNQSTVLYWREY